MEILVYNINTIKLFGEFVLNTKWRNEEIALWLAKIALHFG